MKKNITKNQEEDLVIHIAIKRLNGGQHFCGEKGYGNEDVQQFIKEQRYQYHIKHRRRRNELKDDDSPLPGEASFTTRRWVVERTLD